MSGNTGCDMNAIRIDKCLIVALRFPQKLWRIVNECKTGAISWSSNGLTIIINYDSFSKQYLSCDQTIFKTTNIASFIRQLNLYGFRKVTMHNRYCFNTITNSKIASGTRVHEFLHVYFRSGRPDLLTRVCRKTATAVKNNLMRERNFKKIVSGNNDFRNPNVGMTRLQICQNELKRALEQAIRQYQEEKFFE